MLVVIPAGAGGVADNARIESAGCGLDRGVAVAGVEQVRVVFFSQRYRRRQPRRDAEMAGLERAVRVAERGPGQGVRGQAQVGRAEAG